MPKSGQLSTVAVRSFRKSVARCNSWDWKVSNSAANRTGDRRIGLAIRYIPTYVRQTKVRDAAMLVRGVDEYHHFDYEPRPVADLDAAALAAHADSVSRQVKALYR